MPNEPTLDLLTQVHQGSHMAVQGYDLVIKDAEDPDMKRILAQMQNVHKEVALEASRRLQENGGIPGEPPMFTRVFAWAAEGVQTMMDSSPDKLITVLLDGARMGLSATEDVIDRDFAADPGMMGFAIRYRDQQRSQLERLRTLRRQLH